MLGKLNQLRVLGFLARKFGFVITAGIIGSFCLGAHADQNMAFAWNPSPDTNVIGYILYYGTISGNYASRLDVGTNTTTTVSGLTEGQTYSCVVTAYDAQNQESEPSNELAFVVPGVIRLASTVGSGYPVTLSFPVAPARSYAVQATVDFSSWDTIYQTNATMNCWVNLVDAQATSFPARFYRVALLP